MKIISHEQLHKTGLQSPAREDLSDAVERELSKFLDKEIKVKKLADLFMLALILIFIMFLIA